MRILVTGAAGFIGFHLSKRLMTQGHTVLGYDGMTDYYDPQLKRDRLSLLRGFDTFSFVEGMLEDAERLTQTMNGFEAHIVVHLAAQAGVRYSLEEPRSYITANVVGTHNLLESCRRRPPKHLLLASTSSVYGANRDFPFQERDRTDFPVSLYAATKKACEAMGHSYAHLFGIPTTCFRFFTVYGPWGRPDMALFKFVRAIAAEHPIDVYGNGRMQRDFTYVDDLVDAIAMLMSNPPEGGEPVSDNDSISPVAPFRTVNIAGGTPVTLMEFISAIEAAMNMKARKRLLPMQAGDVSVTHADATLLEQLSGARPATPLESGVAEFVRWFSWYYNTATE